MSISAHKFVEETPVCLESLVGKSISKSQAAILWASVAEKKNIIICGSCGHGKTTLMEALIREVAKGRHQKNAYISLFSEMSFKPDENIRTFQGTGGNSKLADLINTAIIEGAEYLFIDEVRLESDLESIERAINSGLKVVFTVHGVYNVLSERLATLLGYDQDRTNQFLKNFNLKVEAKRLPGSERTIEIYE